MMDKSNDSVTQTQVCFKTIGVGQKFFDSSGREFIKISGSEYIPVVSIIEMSDDEEQIPKFTYTYGDNPPDGK